MGMSFFIFLQLPFWAPHACRWIYDGAGPVGWRQVTGIYDFVTGSSDKVKFFSRPEFFSRRRNLFTSIPLSRGCHQLSPEPTFLKIRWSYFFWDNFSDVEEKNRRFFLRRKFQLKSNFRFSGKFGKPKKVGFLLKFSSQKFPTPNYFLRPHY